MPGGGGGLRLAYVGVRWNSRSDQQIPPGRNGLLSQPDSAVTYTDAMDGALALAGTGIDGLSHSAASGGTLTLSGTGTERSIRTDARPGSVTLTGTSTGSQAHSGTGTGTLSLTGAGVGSQTHTGTGGGTGFLGGSGTESYAHSATGGGAFTLSGTGTDSWSAGAVTYTDGAAGSLVLSGTGTDSWTGPTGDLTASVRITQVGSTELAIAPQGGCSTVTGLRGKATVVVVAASSATIRHSLRGGCTLEMALIED